MIERVHAAALDLHLDPLVSSTDVFVTAVLHVGSKSLSHVLAAIERTKDRLLDVGAASEAARTQIISAVMAYWSAHPGVAITIVEKLLNYSILSPATVIQWALVRHAGDWRGDVLGRAHIYELVFSTVIKVTGRVRHLVSTERAAPATKPAQDERQDLLDVAMDDGTDPAAAAGATATATAGEAEEEEKATREREVEAMRGLFRLIEDSLAGWASGSKDELIEAPTGGDGDGSSEHDGLVRRWGQRWLRVFRRRAAIEEAFLLEAARKAAAAAAGRAAVENGGS